MSQLSDLRISDNAQLVLSAAACLGVIGVIARAYRPKSGLPLPPSPPTWKLGGHVMPPRHSFLTIAEWVEEHGPLITIRSKLEKIVIVGGYKAAVDIMENQGKLTADRPRMVAAGEIFLGGMGIGFAHWGERFRRMRRALHTHLQPKAAEAYEPFQMSHMKNTVLAILDDPHNFQDHVLTYAAAVILQVAYGKTTSTSVNDSALVEIRRFVKVGSAIIVRPGAYLVDTIPWLKYIPWYGRDLREGFERSKKLNLDQLNQVRKQMESGVAMGPSFAKHILENNHGLSETEMAFLGGSFFSAGSETTSSAILTVFMAAACFPEEQAKVQAELDAVIGRHRAPTFADRESLPCLQAFISEALRWRPPLPNGAVAHRTTHDVIWATHQENYCIPAGTTVYGNHWSISRDSDAYPEPDAFKPQRWINDQGGLRDDLKFFPYGFGRRVCPGQHVANRSIFINTLLTLWAFYLTLDPTKPLDDMGFMIGEKTDKPCALEFETRIPETELRLMMQNYPEGNKP
ncbi:cytochrome P450 [Suillus clintonianus]|uniref:cytochrome P450 n=1 Tax=Suillus clintonianus TaxID=1904413 RepID=UPI001B87521F|nr:cytochrome P450 [Suillus clintonianus]KAG2125139.1 cytochrome P450 [Suillus clintonianus]